MTLYVQKVDHYKANGHRLLITGLLVPNFLEYLFLFRRKKRMAFVGRGTKWYNYPSETPVPKSVAKKLEKVSNQIKIYG